jgi:hypothetical protein
MDADRRKIVIFPTSKAEIISQFKRNLPFPAYCSMNWDSFEECLLDFLDEHGEGIEIFHEGGIQLPDDDKEIYLGILHDAMKSHMVIVSSS